MEVNSSNISLPFLPLTKALSISFKYRNILVESSAGVSLLQDILLTQFDDSSNKISRKPAIEIF